MFALKRWIPSLFLRKQHGNNNNGLCCLSAVVLISRCVTCKNGPGWIDTVLGSLWRRHALATWSTVGGMWLPLLTQFRLAVLLPVFDKVFLPNYIFTRWNVPWYRQPGFYQNYLLYIITSLVWQGNSQRGLDFARCLSFLGSGVGCDCNCCLSSKGTCAGGGLFKPDAKWGLFVPNGSALTVEIYPKKKWLVTILALDNLIARLFLLLRDGQQVMDNLELFGFQVRSSFMVYKSMDHRKLPSISWIYISYQANWKLGILWIRKISGIAKFNPVLFSSSCVCNCVGLSFINNPHTFGIKTRHSVMVVQNTTKTDNTT